MAWQHKWAVGTSYKTLEMRDLQTAAILGWSPVVDKPGWTAQDTSKADDNRSDNFMSVSHKQAITSKGGRLLEMTNTNKHTLQTTPIPPNHTTAKCTHVYAHTRAHTHTHTYQHDSSRHKHKNAHTRISPLLHLSLPDETNRTLIHKMEGKNALVYNHWVLHRLGGWIKGQSNIISWYRPLLHTNYSFKWKQDYLNLTVYQAVYDGW